MSSLVAGTFPAHWEAAFCCYIKLRCYPGSDGAVVNRLAGHLHGVGGGRLRRSRVVLGSLQWFLVEEQLGFLAPLLAFFSGRHQ